MDQLDYCSDSQEQCAIALAAIRQYSSKVAYSRFRGPPTRPRVAARSPSPLVHFDTVPLKFR